MSAEGNSPAEQDRHREGMRHIVNQVSPTTARSSQPSSSSDCSYSSCDKSRSPSADGSRGHRRSGSRYSSSYSRSRSRPRCFRASARSRRHPNSSRSSRSGWQRYSRSSSRERYCRRSRRSRSSSYRRTRVAYGGRLMCRFSPSPVRKDKMELPNVAKENAAKVIGVDVVELPSSVKCIEDQMKRTLETDTDRRVRADPVPLKKTAQDKGELDEDVELSKTGPVKKTINFSINNAVAKPSSSLVFHVAESKVTSRADIVGNKLPYGRWIPVKRHSSKKCSSSSFSCCQ